MSLTSVQVFSVFNSPSHLFCSSQEWLLQTKTPILVFGSVLLNKYLCYVLAQSSYTVLTEPNHVPSWAFGSWFSQTFFLLFHMAPLELLEGVVEKLQSLIQLLLITVCHVVTQVLITSHWAAVVCWRLTNSTRPLIFISHQDKENVELKNKKRKKKKTANRQRTKKRENIAKSKTDTVSVCCFVCHGSSKAINLCCVVWKLNMRLLNLSFILCCFWVGAAWLDWLWFLSPPQ